MDKENGAFVEIIDFKKFPQKMRYGAVGMVHGMVTHGLTTNYFSELVHGYQIAADGSLQISISAASSAILYDISDEISVALRYLQGFGWFDENVVFSTGGPSEAGLIVVQGWRDVWDFSASHDFASYLEEVWRDLENNGRIYTVEWFYAKVSHLYFKDPDSPSVAMTIGILLSQMWWKVDQEDAAMRGHQSLTHLERANKAKAFSVKKQSDAKNTAIISLWHKALEKHGANAMRRDSNAAQAIFALASEALPRELQKRSSGEIIGPEAIRKRISTLRRQGKIG